MRRFGLPHRRVQRTDGNSRATRRGPHDGRSGDSWTTHSNGHNDTADRARTAGRNENERGAMLLAAHRRRDGIEHTEETNSRGIDRRRMKSPHDSRSTRRKRGTLLHGHVCGMDGRLRNLDSFNRYLSVQRSHCADNSITTVINVCQTSDLSCTAIRFQKPHDRRAAIDGRNQRLAAPGHGTTLHCSVGDPEPRGALHSTALTAGNRSHSGAQRDSDSGSEGPRRARGAAGQRCGQLTQEKPCTAITQTPLTPLAVSRS